jgi:hypothetical protein
MDYMEVIDYIYTERNKIDRAVEEVFRVNGNGQFFRIALPAAVMEYDGDEPIERESIFQKSIEVMERDASAKKQD